MEEKGIDFLRLYPGVALEKALWFLFMLAWRLEKYHPEDYENTYKHLVDLIGANLTLVQMDLMLIEAYYKLNPEKIPSERVIKAFFEKRITLEEASRLFQKYLKENLANL